MAFVCRGPLCLCRDTRGTQLWPLYVRLHGSLGPKALLLPALPGQQHLNSWSLSLINAEVSPERASEEVTTSPARATEEKLPSVQLASFQGSETGWQVENSTL